MRYFVILLLFTSSIQGQFKIPETPKIQTSLYDYANVLNSLEAEEIKQKLIKYADTTSTQLVLITFNSTEGENINYLGAQWGEKWGIGQEEDNGILILLAYNDRKIAINTGKGTEHLLTDAMSKRIIDEDIIPYFKTGDYYGGLNSGVDAIFEVMTGAYEAKKQEEELPMETILFLMFVFLIFLIAISSNRNNGSNNRGERRFKNDNAADIIEAIILSSSGRGGYRKSSGGFGGGWSTGGGGFSGGFGGGSFGGGGASGGW